MYAPEAIPLTADQIQRIQTAARIIEMERALGGAVLNTAHLWWKKELSDAAFSDIFPIALDQYGQFKERNPTLPI